MTVYPRLVRIAGRPMANLIVIALRAGVMTAIIFLADKGFTSFNYLQGG